MSEKVEIVIKTDGCSQVVKDLSVDLAAKLTCVLDRNIEVYHAVLPSDHIGSVVFSGIGSTLANAVYQYSDIEELTPEQTAHLFDTFVAQARKSLMRSVERRKEA